MGSEGYILFRHYRGCKWYILVIKQKNNFKILARIPVDPENNKQLIGNKGFQAEIKSGFQESMDSINNTDEKPTATAPPSGWFSPPAGRITLVERISHEVKKSPTAKDISPEFESLEYQQQKEFLRKLVESENQYDDLGFEYNIIQDKPTALKVLKMFYSEIYLNW